MMFKFREIKETLSENAPGIATVLSMALTGLSLYFAIKKAPEGARAAIQYEKAKADIENKPLADQNKNDEMSAKIAYGVELAKTYKESIACAAGAMVCAYASNKWNGNKIALLGMTLAAREDTIRKIYKHADKVFGKGGKNDLKEMVDCDVPPFDPEEDTVKAKRSRKHRKDQVEKFYLAHNGTAFESTMADVDDAFDRARDIIRKDPRHILHMNKLLSLLGLPDAPTSVNDIFREDFAPFRPYTKVVMVNGDEYIGIFFEYDPCAGDYSKRVY